MYMYRYHFGSSYDTAGLLSLQPLHVLHVCFLDIRGLRHGTSTLVRARACSLTRLATGIEEVGSRFVSSKQTRWLKNFDIALSVIKHVTQPGIGEFSIDLEASLHRSDGACFLDSAGTCSDVDPSSTSPQAGCSPVGVYSIVANISSRASVYIGEDSLMQVSKQILASTLACILSPLASLMQSTVAHKTS